MTPSLNICFPIQVQQNTRFAFTTMNAMKLSIVAMLLAVLVTQLPTATAHDDPVDETEAIHEEMRRHAAGDDMDEWRRKKWNFPHGKDKDGNWKDADGIPDDMKEDRKQSRDARRERHHKSREDARERNAKRHKEMLERREKSREEHRRRREELRSKRHAENTK
jgi:hypothetical protein